MASEFLVIEDDALVASALRGVLRAYGSVATASTAREAREALPRNPWTGIVADIALPDGNGLDVVESAAAGPRTLVFTGYSDAAFVNRAFDLGAEIAIKPIDCARITEWARRKTSPDDAWLAKELAEWHVRYTLTASELH